MLRSDFGERVKLAARRKNLLFKATTTSWKSIQTRSGAKSSQPSRRSRRWC